MIPIYSNPPQGFLDIDYAKLAFSSSERHSGTLHLDQGYLHRLALFPRGTVGKLMPALRPTELSSQIHYAKILKAETVACDSCWLIRASRVLPHFRLGAVLIHGTPFLLNSLPPDAVRVRVHAGGYAVCVRENECEPVTTI